MCLYGQLIAFKATQFGMDAFRKLGGVLARG